MLSNEEYNYKTLLYVALTCSLGNVAWGYNISIFNAMRAYLQTYVFPNTSELEIVLVGSLPTIGAAAGSLYAAKFANSIGRLNTLLLNDILGLVGSLLCMVGILPVVILGRTLQGITTGINSVCVPLYNIEMADVSVKGRMGGLSIIALSFGLGVGLAAELLVPVGEEATGSQIWRPLMGFASILHVARIILFKSYFNYETPLYLTLKDRFDDAKKILKVFYKTDANTETQLQRVLKDKQAVTAKGNPTLKDLLTPKYKKAFLISMYLLSGAQFCGFYPIFMFFNVFALESAGNDLEIVSIFATIMGIISFLTVILSTIVIDKVGRRPLIVYGMLMITVTEFLYVVVGFTGGLGHPALKYLLMIWPIFYRLSVGTLGFVYCAEVLPGIGVSACMFMNWMLGFVAIQSLMPLAHSIGATGAMFLYFVYSFIATVVFAQHVIETKGKTKAEIIQLYRSDGGSMIDLDAKTKDVEMSLRASLMKK